MVSTPKIKCNRHGYPPGEHENYFNGNCIWCLIEDRNGLQAKNDTLMRDLKSCHESKTKFGDKIMELRIEIDRLTKLGEERHIRAKDTEESLMEHVERLQAEAAPLLADVRRLVEAARRVIKISDRNHDAWNDAKQALAAVERHFSNKNSKP